MPQDVFFVARHTPALGPVENLFLSSHDVRWFLTPPLKQRQHASERMLFHLPLSLGLPLDVMWHDGGHCSWMLVDDRRLDDARAPRAVFRGRCARLRNVTRPLGVR